jgi:hypothetical protein
MTCELEETRDCLRVCSTCGRYYDDELSPDSVDEDAQAAGTPADPLATGAGVAYAKAAGNCFPCAYNASLEHLTEINAVDLSCPGCRPRIESVTLRGNGPAHRPSPNCESGGRPHCTCDTCF